MTACVFDTGALIALERRDAWMSKRLRRLHELGWRVLVPTPVIGEWWKGRSDWRERLLRPLTVEALDAALAKIAADAMTKVDGATLVDSVVMACAARAGALVYTSDFDDLTRLQAHFPSVRVLAVGRGD